MRGAPDCFRFTLCRDAKISPIFMLTFYVHPLLSAFACLQIICIFPNIKKSVLLQDYKKQRKGGACLNDAALIEGLNFFFEFLTLLTWNHTNSQSGVIQDASLNGIMVCQIQLCFPSVFFSISALDSLHPSLISLSMNCFCYNLLFSVFHSISLSPSVNSEGIH